MKQIAKSIYEFKKGDRITRIQPSKSLMKFGEEDVVNRDHIGTPFIFVGIANGCIYLKRNTPKPNKEADEMISFLRMFGIDENPLLNLELSIFDEGWAHYIDPMSLMDETTHENYTREELIKRKREALESEDYLEADRLQKILNKMQ